MENLAVRGEGADSPRFLEDFSVGDLIESRTITVSGDMVRSFAQAYDPQPMHLDEDAARKSVFGKLVGSGWQTLAITMRLLVDAKLLGSTPIVGADFKDIRFHAPMLPGDTLHAKAEVLSVRTSKSRPERGFLEVKVTTMNDKGAILITQTWTLVLPSRAPARSI